MYIIQGYIRTFRSHYRETLSRQVTLLLEFLLNLDHIKYLTFETKIFLVSQKISSKIYVFTTIHWKLLFNNLEIALGNTEFQHTNGNKNAHIT